MVAAAAAAEGAMVVAAAAYRGVLLLRLLQLGGVQRLLLSLLHCNCHDSCNWER